MTKGDFLWPKPGNKLFVEGDEQGCWMGHEFWRRNHAQGFKYAADLLVDSHLQPPRQPYHDELIFPIAYLYRHAIELKLKRIVRLGVLANLYGKEDVEDVLADHKLAQLWTKAKIVINDRWPNATSPDLAAAESLINELHRIDPKGQFFRYSTDASGQAHKYDRLPQYVSLENLKKAAGAAFNFLEACEDGIDDGIQAMRDAM